MALYDFRHLDPIAYRVLLLDPSPHDAEMVLLGAGSGGAGEITTPH